MNVPASLIRDRALAPVLDARAENLHQQRLIANPTPQIDSICEHLHALAATATPAQRHHVRELVRLVRALAASNTTEGERETAVAGVCDQLAHDLRHAESAQRRARTITVRSLARALRGPLDVLVHARRHDGTAYVAAVRAVEDVLRTVPSAHLLDNVSLRHELGLAKYDRLVALIAERTA